MVVTEALVELEAEKRVGVRVEVTSLDRGLRWIERSRRDLRDLG